MKLYIYGTVGLMSEGGRVWRLKRSPEYWALSCFLPVKNSAYAPVAFLMQTATVDDLGTFPPGRTGRRVAVGMQ